MTDLITLECYKDYKRINSTSKDNLIQSLITQTSALVETYCNRKFLDYASSPNYITEWFDAKTNIVTLKHFPVISVVSVRTSQDGGLNTTSLTENDAGYGGYYVDLENGQVRTQRDTLPFLYDYDTSYKSLEVDYHYGYSETPEDLQLAINDLVHYYIEDESAPTKSLLGATIDNPLPYLANSFPPHIRRILDLYRIIE
jgi:hypothetical protein